jgi:hypothetical protein
MGSSIGDFDARMPQQGRQMLRLTLQRPRRRHDHASFRVNNITLPIIYQLQHDFNIFTLLIHSVYVI